VKQSVLTQLFAIARNVWLEAARDRGIQILGIGGVAGMVFSLVLGRMAVGGRIRVVQDMGFWVLWIFGIFTVLYLGSNLVRQEIQKRTVYLILSRPVARTTFLLGKYCGIVLVFLSIYVILALSFLIIMFTAGIDISYQHIIAVLFILGEWFLLGAFSIFFATFTSPLLHNFFTVGIGFLGHWCNDLRLFAANSDSYITKHLLNLMYFILPNLETLNFRAWAIYGESITPQVIFTGIFFVMSWSLLAITAASLIFHYRKLL